ncbi:MAG: undecaprenyl-phosphate glucose phosphotransferase [Chloroflexota bacterium]
MKSENLRAWYTFTLVILDGLMITLAFVLSFIIRDLVPFPSELTETTELADLLGLIIISASIIVIALFLYQQYYIPRAVSRVDQFYSIFLAVSLGTLIAVAVSVFVFSPEFEFPRMMIIYAWAFTILLLMLGRFGHYQARLYLQRRGIGRDRLIIVGSGEMARIVLQRILWSPSLGYEVIGIIDGDFGSDDIMGIPVVGTTEDLPRLIEESAIDEVIIAIPEKGHRAAVEIIAICERGEVSIKVFPDIFQMVATQPTIDDLGGLPLLSVRDYAMRGYLLVFKRLFDLIFSIIALIIASPLMILVALAIRIESPGEVFFVQERMGLDGKPFKILKFRSMRNDAEQRGPGWTVKNDPRQTRMGRLLRRLDIDEWPQLINVVIGEMSLVGPRPEQPFYVNQFRESVPRYMDRHRAKAGLTGWAQVNGLRGDTSIVERTKFDLWYIENWNLLLDIKIIIRTVWQNIYGAGS